MVMARVGSRPSWSVVKTVADTAGQMIVNWFERIVGGRADD